MAKKKQIVPRQVKLVQQYRSVFSSPEGQDVLYDMLLAHGFLKSNYKSGPNATADLLVLEGERNVILRLLSKLNTDPQQILERIKQHEMAMAES